MTTDPAGDGTPPPTDHRALRLHVSRTARRVKSWSARAQTTAVAPCYCQPGARHLQGRLELRRRPEVRPVGLPAAADDHDDGSGRRRCAIRAKCGPQLGLPNTICADGSTGGPTGRCRTQRDGTCGWEVRECPPTGCYGICVPNVPQTGCQVNTDCPMGQTCDVACREWGACPAERGSGTPTTTTTDPATGHDRAAAAAGAAPAMPPTQLRLRRQRRVQGPDVRRPVRAASPPPTPAIRQPVACPTIAPGLPERR